MTRAILTDVAVAMQRQTKPHTEDGQVLHDLLLDRGVTIASSRTYKKYGIQFPSLKVTQNTRRWMVWATLCTLENEAGMRDPKQIVGTAQYDLILLRNFYLCGDDPTGVMGHDTYCPWWVNHIKHIVDHREPIYHGSMVPAGYATDWVNQCLRLIAGMGRKQVLGTQVPDIPWVQNLICKS